MSPPHSHDPFELRHTNVSQPQLQHTASQHSAAASEDYYSLSSRSNHSEDAVHHIRPSLQRYSTPPSRYRTPLQSQERIPRDLYDLSNTAMRGPGRRRVSEPIHNYPNPLQSHPRISPIRRKPVPSTVYETNSPDSSKMAGHVAAQSSAAKALEREASPPTPNADDTPYIVFALDQLTRDEEVRGSRRYPGTGEDSPTLPATRTSHATEGLAVPRPQGEALAVSRPTTEYLPTPLLEEERQYDPRFSAISRDSGLWTKEAAPVSTSTHAETSGPVRGNPSWSPVAPEFPAQATIPMVAETDAPQAIPPRHPARELSRELRTHRISEPDIFLPFDPPQDSLYTPLTELPTILRPLSLGLFILALIFFITALLFTAIWSIMHTGLWSYGSFGDGRYFVFQYLPTLLGMIILLWLIEIEIAVYRVAPFIALTSGSARARSHAPILPLYPSGFTLPSLVQFKAGQPAIGIFLLCSWLSVFTIPLLSTSFNVYFVSSSGQWMWLATQGVIWVVIALYIILTLAIIVLFFYLRKNHTGLKWDPRSLADIAVLLERSNILDTYASYDSYPHQVDFTDHIRERGDRLGYWRSSQRPNDIFHALGAPNQPARQYAVRDGRITEIRAKRVSGQTLDPESGRFSHGTANSLIPRRATDPAEDADHDHQPWFLRPLSNILWSTTALILLLAFLIVSYLPSTAIKSGFLPDLPISVNSTGFSSPNFLYSFIPSFLGTLCFLYWYTLDMNIRRLQPYASLSTPDGSLAENSLLLSYTSDGLGLVSLKAAANHHYRVALMSLTTLIASTLPILAGGVFWAQFYVPQQRVRISGHMPAFYALTAFLCLYAISYPFLLPLTRRQAEAYSLPMRNQGKRLVDVVALLHQSRILCDLPFRAPATRYQLITRLLSTLIIDSSRPTTKQSEKGFSGNKELSSDQQPSSGPMSTAGQMQQRNPSRVSLVDSLRGLASSRQAALQESHHQIPTGPANTGKNISLVHPRYALGTYTGRDGERYFGIDRVERDGVEGLVTRKI